MKALSLNNNYFKASIKLRGELLDIIKIMWYQSYLEINTERLLKYKDYGWRMPLRRVDTTVVWKANNITDAGFLEAKRQSLRGRNRNTRFRRLFPAIWDNRCILLFWSFFLLFSHLLLQSFIAYVDTE